MVICGYIMMGASIVLFIICEIYFDLGKAPVFVMSIIFVVGLVFVNHEELNKYNQAKKQEQIKQGGYYLKQCKLLEVNIDNGFFSSATNKLSCDGTIVNIDKSDYDNLVSKYKSSIEK